MRRLEESPCQIPSGLTPRRCCVSTGRVGRPRTPLGGCGHSSLAPPTQVESQKVQAAHTSSQGLPEQAADQGSRVDTGEPELQLHPTGECLGPSRSAEGLSCELSPAPPPRQGEEDLDLPTHMVSREERFAGVPHPGARSVAGSQRQHRENSLQSATFLKFIRILHFTPPSMFICSSLHKNMP